MDTETKTTIQALKSEIKEWAGHTRAKRTEARRILAAARQSTDPAEKGKLYGNYWWAYTSTKSGSDQRERLLAYGYLRGRTYHQIEQKCRTTPSARCIADYAGVDRASIEHWFTTEGSKRECPQQTDQAVA